MQWESLCNDDVYKRIAIVDYHCVITKISKSEAANLLQKADLNKKA